MLIQRMICVICCSIALGQSANCFAAEEKQRNVVFILVDDQRWDAIGKLNPFFETPHLDSMMDSGIYFPNMFVTTSLCSPSRAN